MARVESEVRQVTGAVKVRNGHISGGSQRLPYPWMGTCFLYLRIKRGKGEHGGMIRSRDRDEGNFGGGGLISDTNGRVPFLLSLEAHALDDQG